MESVNFICEKVLINPKGKLAIYVMYRYIDYDVSNNEDNFTTKIPRYNLVLDFYDNDEYIPLIENMEYALTSNKEGIFEDTYEEEKTDVYTRIYEIISLQNKDFGINYYYNSAFIDIDYPECKEFSADKPIIKNAIILI